MWEDHLQFLEALRELPVELFELPVVLAGDFNQRVPRGSQPHRAFDALLAALSERFHLATAGLGAPPDDHLLIDHIAHSWDQRTLRVEAFHGRDLSDHDGVVADLVIESP